MKKSVAASEKPAKAKEFDKELFKRSVEYNVRTLYRKNLEEADAQQIFQAVSYAIKDRIVENWMETQKAYEKEDLPDVVLPEWNTASNRIWQRPVSISFLLHPAAVIRQKAVLPWQLPLSPEAVHC